jgi:histidinol-phosphate aminotransferase
MDYRRFLREDVGELEEYQPVKPLDVLAEEIGLPVEQLVKLDANENLYGAPAAVYDAIAKADLHIYPDPSQTHLREAIAGYVGGGVTPEQVVCGTGADDLIDLIFRLTLPEKVAVVTPAFGMYSFLAKINRVQPVEVPRRPGDFALDVDALRAAVDDGGRIAFLTSPNNPTGNALPIDEARAVCQLGALVIIDEAYIEFGGESAVPLLAEFPNLVILRTFSKWAGIAGLRVGYALCDAGLAKLMMAIKQPYNVNIAADVAAQAAIEHRGEIFETVQALIAERGRMVHLLEGLGWLKALPSDSNFVLFRVEGRSAKAVVKGLRQQGVLVRYYPRPDLAEYIRISAGRPEDTDRLVAALRQVVTR